MIIYAADDPEVIRTLKTDNPDSLGSLQRVTWANAKALTLPKKKDKASSPVILHLTNRRDASRALRDRVVILGTKYPTEKSRRLVTQCHRCQRFGHTVARCARQQAVCGRCGEDGRQPTECKCPNSDSPCTDHKSCPHTVTKCSNCKGDHRASSQECPKYISAQRALDDVHAQGGHYFLTNN